MYDTFSLCVRLCCLFSHSNSYAHTIEAYELVCVRRFLTVERVRLRDMCKWYAAAVGMIISRHQSWHDATWGWVFESSIAANITPRVHYTHNTFRCLAALSGSQRIPWANTTMHTMHALHRVVVCGGRCISNAANAFVRLLGLYLVVNVCRESRSRSNKFNDEITEITTYIILFIFWKTSSDDNKY